MVTSMTGYGRDVTTFHKAKITVEIRSVNHRFLDISTKIPRSLLFLEDKIKKTIQSFFHRGRLDIFISMEGEGVIQQELVVNWGLLDQFVTSLNNIKEQYDLKGEIPVDMVTTVDGLLTVQEVEQGHDEMKESILNAITIACEQVYEMRIQEGSELHSELDTRLGIIQDIVKNLGERREAVIIEYRERIRGRILEYTKDEFVNEESRVLQEIALLAEKGDITEEVLRLNSHVRQFRDTLNNDGAIGRKLDFITQEMHREANTIGSKSNDPQISEWVVILKSEIEKIKEQVQNVE
ncbi:YicC/YloC family endoribonuclease [Terrihalobacillus insolitus]|uniref:YicC/YloC family endoribonuclease n=1 Tax=Terrihalobacillus insolitus TaxID=2950438 RepID=UPI00233F859C|nr:YicC/YloC family endoribonuclease [Terrihalobacillus insolitus]MDC3412889.1 YicC family protein [Terrihalobacillus insolitus]